MRFLLDENQSPLLVGLLAAGGHDVAHGRDLGHAGSSDESSFALAVTQGWVIISGDTDFGELLARTNAPAPSVILLRRQTGRRAAQIAALLLANLAAVHDDLDAGADRRVRSRPHSRAFAPHPPLTVNLGGLSPRCPAAQARLRRATRMNPHAARP